MRLLLAQQVTLLASASVPGGLILLLEIANSSLWIQFLNSIYHTFWGQKLCCQLVRRCDHVKSWVVLLSLPIFFSHLKCSLTIHIFSYLSPQVKYYHKSYNNDEDLKWRYFLLIQWNILATHTPPPPPPKIF